MLVWFRVSQRGCVTACTDGSVAFTEAVVTPINADTVARTSNNCIAAVSDSTLPDEPPSSLVAIVASDDPSTQSAVTAGLPAYDSDVITESAVVSTPVGSSTASFIASSSYTAITQSFLASGGVRTDVDWWVRPTVCCMPWRTRMKKNWRQMNRQKSGTRKFLIRKSSTFLCIWFTNLVSK